MGNSYPKYTDGMFFDAACRSILENGNKAHILDVIALLDARIGETETGSWKTSLGMTRNREALEMLANLLRQNVSHGVLKVFQSEIEQDVYKQKKYKIVFFLQDQEIWPAVECLYRAASMDERFEVQAVYVPFYHINKLENDNGLEIYRDKGVPVINYDQYDLSAENPDIAIITKPYKNIPEQYYIKEVEKIVKYTIYVPYGLELNKRLIRYGFGEYCHYSVWRHLAYGSIVKEYGAKYGYRDGENIVVWGHPRVDNYLEKNLPAPNLEWQAKIKGRKVVLWCPHHTIVPGPESVSTWKENYKTMFSLFEKHKDVVLLWRPHPLLFGAIVNNGYMTQKELDKFIASKLVQDNIILDQTSDYRTAFSMSDAIVSDGTTFSIEYLLTGKPLMVTANTLEQFYQPEEMEDALYIGRTSKDIQEFIENVILGIDPKQEKRARFTDSLFVRSKDTSICIKILDNIITAINDEISQVFKSYS